LSVHNDNLPRVGEPLWNPSLASEGSDPQANTKTRGATGSCLPSKFLRNRAGLPTTYTDVVLGWLTVTEKRRSPLAVRISPDLEAAITEQASTSGEPVPDYVRRVLYEVTTERREVVEGTAAK